jgi:hypothetical protein
MESIPKDTIAQKNDQMRKTLTGGKVFLTQGVECHPKRNEIISAVKTFDNFTEDNDAYGEHDCAIFKLGNEDFMFKIDYYDDNYEYFKEDGNRVLTIMCADEY